MRPTPRILLHASLAVLASASFAHAGQILAGGPLRIGANHYYACTAVNVGAAPIGQIDVKVTIDGSTPGSGAKATCNDVAPNTVCEAENQAGGSQYRFCTVSVAGNRKNVRATLCDTTTGECIPLQ